MRKIASLIAAMAFAMSAVPAQALDTAVCDDGLRSAEAEETAKVRKKPLAVPEEFSAIAQLDGPHLKIKTMSGEQFCILTDWMIRIVDMESFADGRFLGFHYYAMEADGYVLIDRTGKGEQIATGNRPYFTVDNTKFVALQVSGAGWGNLEGLAVWHVDGKSVQRVLYVPTAEFGLQNSIHYFDANSGCGLMAVRHETERAVLGYFTFALNETAGYDDIQGLDLYKDSDINQCIIKTTGQTISEVRANRTGTNDLPANWYAIHEGPDPMSSGRSYDLYFADEHSIFEIDGYYSVAASRLEMFENRASDIGTDIIEYRTRNLIDCKQQRYKVLEYVKYGKDAQFVSENHFDAESREWLDVQAGTSQEALAKFVCEPDSRIGEQRWAGHLEPRQLIIALSQADWSK